MLTLKSNISAKIYGPPWANVRFGFIISDNITESEPYLLRNNLAHSIPSCKFRIKLMLYLLYLFIVISYTCPNPPVNDSENYSIHNYYIYEICFIPISTELRQYLLVALNIKQILARN